LVYNRTGTAPWSLSREAGIQSATVDSTIEVPQYLQPVINTGDIDLKGNWKGIVSSDEEFLIDPAHLEIPNGAAVLSPQLADASFIDMTGFNDLFVAFKVSNGGDFAIQAVMGPDSNTFANLSPVDAASGLMGNFPQSSPNDFTSLFVDSAQALVADVWNIFSLVTILKNQKLLQFKITNNSGGNSDIEFASLRVV
jgi:hypothetical protein